MDIVALKQEINDLKKYRDDKNVLISNINMDNYEGAAKEFFHKDLKQWNEDVAYLNDRILALNKQIYEYEVEQGQK